MSDAAQLYAEDLAEGFAFTGGETELTSGMFMQFADLTGDRHPIHYDAAYAARTRFRKPVAHGLLLTAMTALGATDLSPRLEAAMVALIGQTAEFVAPAFVGDRLTAFYRVVSNTLTKSGATSRVELSVDLRNASGETVLQGRHVYLLRCRPA
jgi:acyl dehydratase